MTRLLIDTLTSVLAELDRLAPESLAAARAHGVLAGYMAAPPVRRRAVTQKAATDSDREIAAYYAAGNSILACSTKFGRAPVTIYRALERCGQPTRQRGAPRAIRRDARVDEMIAMRDLGHTLEEIGRRFNVTRERARQLLRRAGVGTGHHDRPLTAEELHAARVYASGESLDAAGAMLPGGRNIRAVLAKAGIQVRTRERANTAQLKARLERVSALQAQGMAPKGIAKAIGARHVEHVYRDLARLRGKSRASA